MFARSAAANHYANCRSDKRRAVSHGNNGAAYGNPGANPRADRNHSADFDAHRRADGNGYDCAYRDTDRNSHGRAYRNSESNPNGHA